MHTYATAQHIGTRDTQCDATAVRTAPNGARAYVLLDGIGSDQDVREWARAAAARLARAAARRGNAEAGLRAVYESYAAEREAIDPWGRLPKAAAVVAVTAPARPLTIAWCGDARAYVITRGAARRLTDDHNLRRVFPPTDQHNGGNRNVITSYLGSVDSDQDVKNRYNHPAIEAVTLYAAPSADDPAGTVNQVGTLVTRQSTQRDAVTKLARDLYGTTDDHGYSRGRDSCPGCDHFQDVYDNLP